MIEIAAPPIAAARRHDASSRGRQMLNKVPEITLYFWVIKILCTTVGETAADLLNENLGLGLSGTSYIMGACLVVVERFYPSNKTCATCRHLRPALSLATRRGGVRVAAPGTTGASTTGKSLRRRTSQPQPGWPPMPRGGDESRQGSALRC